MSGLHKNVPVGVESSHPLGYNQTGDPGAVGAYRPWVDTTTAGAWLLKIRNAADGAWEVIKAAPVGAAGGALAGTYPNPTIGAGAVLPDGVTATTQLAADDSTKVATTAFVHDVVAAAGGVADLDDLTDVDTSTTPPTTGDVLTFDGTNWVPDAPSGGGGGSETLISEQVVGGGGAASVTFSSISSSYRDLRLVIRGRGTTASTAFYAAARFNGDTGNNYDYRGRLWSGGDNAFGSSNASSTRVALITGSTATANEPGASDCRIYDYRSTTWNKRLTWIGSAIQPGEALAVAGGGGWHSTSAVTSIDVFPESGNWAAGSVLSLYGIL